MVSNWLHRLFARAFAEIPAESIGAWAERVVRFKKKHSKNPRYVLSDTPWANWLMEIWRHPWRMRKGRLVRIRRLIIKKCTQSGFTEAILNGIRWDAKFCPRNFLYSINSKEEAENIRERLVDTLEQLGEGVFHDGETPADLQQYVLRLREMIGWFIGSFSSGAFANKYAPRQILDEYDDHGQKADNTDNAGLAKERGKTAEDEDLTFILGKPKLKGGPIDKEHVAGDQFEWMVPCPHCETHQLLEWDRVRFKFAKDLTDQWDLDRVLTETYYECVCGCRIEEKHKPWMEERGHWYLVKAGDPETVSLHMSDLHSMRSSSTWGILAKEFIQATAKAAAGNLKDLQGFWNGRLGLGFEQRVQKIEMTDVMKCRSAYRRGIVPYPNLLLIGTMDVGQFVNTNWSVMALNPATVEAWVIDYGTAGQPADFLDVMKRRYLCPATQKTVGIAMGFMDCKFLREKVFSVALQMPRRIWPTLGMKPGTSTRSISFNQVAGKPPWFGVITFVRADANADLYLDRIKAQRPPRLHLPEDAGEDFMAQLCAERLLKDPVTGALYWAEKPSGPNHWGDSVSIGLTGYDYLIQGPRTRAAGVAGESPIQPAAPVAPSDPLPALGFDINLLTSEGPAPA